MRVVEQLRLFDLSTVPTVWDGDWDEDEDEAPCGQMNMSPEQLAELSGDALHELAALSFEALVDLSDHVGSVLYELESEPNKRATDVIYNRLSELSDFLAAEIDRRVDLRFHCLDCDVHTGDIGQYPYHCPDKLWHAVVPNGHGMLCLPCLSKRLAWVGLPWPFPRPAEVIAADLLKLGTVGAA